MRPNTFLQPQYPKNPFKMSIRRDMNPPGGTQQEEDKTNQNDVPKFQFCGRIFDIIFSSYLSKLEREKRVPTSCAVTKTLESMKV